MKSVKNITPNPNHCPASRLVVLKELDELKHLVRKYPDVALGWLTHQQISAYAHDVIGWHMV